MATKIPIAQKRMFTDVFVCKECKKKLRSQATRVAAGKTKCPRCGSQALRPIKKK
jgi:ribosomal protein L40E